MCRASARTVGARGIRRSSNRFLFEFGDFWSLQGRLLEALLVFVERDLAGDFFEGLVAKLADFGFGRRGLALEFLSRRSL